jgi:hypothetical protein
MPNSKKELESKNDWWDILSAYFIILHYTPENYRIQIKLLLKSYKAHLNKIIRLKNLDFNPEQWEDFFFKGLERLCANRKINFYLCARFNREQKNNWLDSFVQKNANTKELLEAIQSCFLDASFQPNKDLQDIPTIDKLSERLGLPCTQINLTTLWTHLLTDEEVPKVLNFPELLNSNKPSTLWVYLLTEFD